MMSSLAHDSRIPSVRASPHVQAVGESAVEITFHDDDPELAWREAHALADRLRGAQVRGIRSLLPTFRAVLVEIDPLEVSTATIESIVRVLSASAAPSGDRPGRVFVVPVVYGGDEGPDLVDVAAFYGMTPDDLVAVHSARAVRIRCLGPAASPMTDGPPSLGPIPRLATPRVRVAAGSVAIAGVQGMIWTSPSPTGWHVIGRTPATLIDPRSEPPVTYRPGDSIRYRVIDRAEWHAETAVSVEEVAP